MPLGLSPRKRAGRSRADSRNPLWPPQVLSHHLFFFICPSDAPFTCEEKFHARVVCPGSALHAERFPRVSRAREAVAGGSIPPRYHLFPLCPWFCLLPLSKSVPIIIFPPLFLRLATHEASSAPRPFIVALRYVHFRRDTSIDKQTTGRPRLAHIIARVHLPRTTHVRKILPAPGGRPGPPVRARAVPPVLPRESVISSA